MGICAQFVPLAEEFQPQLIMMVDGCDTHFRDRITGMGLTLEGIYMIADRVCRGKVAAFAGSGYDLRGILFPRGWLASICGLTGIEVDLEEPYPIPPRHRRDYAALETKGIVQAVKAKLAPCWKCFASP